MTPVSLKSTSVLVTTIRSWTTAVAAIRPAASPRERFAVRRPHSTATSIGYGKNAIGMIVAEDAEPFRAFARRPWIGPRLDDDSSHDFT
jgi:hypothetical protein